MVSGQRGDAPHAASDAGPSPSQPAKVDPGAGVATSVTCVGQGEVKEGVDVQPGPQSMPAGSDTTRPSPLPALTRPTRQSSSRYVSVQTECSRRTSPRVQWRHS